MEVDSGIGTASSPRSGRSAAEELRISLTTTGQCGPGQPKCIRAADEGGPKPFPYFAIILGMAAYSVRRKPALMACPARPTATLASRGCSPPDEAQARL
jgi:hypothetical protein